MKKRVAFALCMMLIASVCIPQKASATTITTNVYACSGAAYEYYVRETGNTNLLGIMRIEKKSNKISKSFCSKRDGSLSAKAYVSKDNSYWYSSNLVQLSYNDSITKTVNMTNPSYAYGKATVVY